MSQDSSCPPRIVLPARPAGPHFASAHIDGLDKEIVRRWLLSNDAYEQAAYAKDGGTLRSPRGLRSGCRTLARQSPSPATWCGALWALPPLLPSEPDLTVP